MRFRFSLKTTVVCLILAALMVRASFWQWDRHTKKQLYIKELNLRLNEPVVPLLSVLPDSEVGWEKLINRRVTVSGEYDFDREMILRNRRYEDIPGVFLLTPLKIDDSTNYILVSRGYIPLAWSSPDKRTPFQKTKRVSFTALVKESSAQVIFAPADPPSGGGNPWVDAWLRVNIPEIQKQLSYKVLPVYLEVMGDDANSPDMDRIIQSKSGRDEMFFLPSESPVSSAPSEETIGRYPIPIYDTVIPAGRHLGYVYEWAAMAILTILIGVILQMRRPQLAKPNTDHMGARQS